MTTSKTATRGWVKMLFTALILPFIFSFCSQAYAEDVVPQDHTRVAIKSEFLGEARTINIRLPAGYETSGEKTYPVLYVLNEDSNFEWASYIVELQASRFGIEDMLVVGIPHAGNYSRDNYPFAGQNSVQLNPQAQNHSAFIREEVVPFVEQNFRVHGGRAIIGHSLSGLFVAPMFVEHSDAFSTFIAISPSFHHAPQMSSIMRTFLLEVPDDAGQIYMALGSLEHEEAQQGYRDVIEAIQSVAPQIVDENLTYMPNTDHLLGAFQGTYSALAWMYKEYTIQSEIAQNLTFDEYISHYEELSERLGYTVKPRKRHLTGYAQFMIKRVGDSQAGITALRVAQHYYPDAQDVRDLIQELLPDIQN